MSGPYFGSLFKQIYIHKEKKIYKSEYTYYLLYFIYMYICIIYIKRQPVKFVTLVFDYIRKSFIFKV